MHRQLCRTKYKTTLIGRLYMAKKQFKAESKRLLDLMINSIYTHKEIFLREIISNASDAIDKRCYLALTDENVGMSRDDFRIRIKVDKDVRTISVSDNGIGMNKAEMESNLGVIARSGSLQFKQDLPENSAEAAPDLDIIGQFGVGFYSAFMVSDKVTVLSHRYGEETGAKWESSGADGYTVDDFDKEDIGTEVIMHIKPDTEEEHYSEYLDTIAKLSPQKEKAEFYYYLFSESGFDEKIIAEAEKTDRIRLIAIDDIVAKR